MTVISPSRAEREQFHTARFMKMIPLFTPEAAPGTVAGAVPVSVPDVAEWHSPTRSKAHQKPRKAPQLSTEDQSPPSPEAVPEWLTDALKVYEEQQARPPRAQVRLHQESEGQAHPIPQAPPPLAELLNLDALRPRRGKGAGSAGAGALATLLHALASHVLERRPSLRRRDGRLPRQVVLHLSAEMLAAALGVDESTARRWTQRLEEVGYLHARPHYTTLTENGGSRTVVDGTLYAIRLEAGHQAHLSYQDLNRQYRDLNADRAAGRTAHAAVRQARQQAAQANSVPDEEKNMPGSTDLSISSKSIYLQLKEWAVTPGHFKKNPLRTDPRIIPPAELGETLKTVQDVVYTLPLVAEAHPTRRAPLVGIMAATLARALNDGHSRAWYCRLIWNAWRAETEGRAGLRVLAAQLERLDIDRREWTSLRNPAALLAARLRVA